MRLRLLAVFPLLYAAAFVAIALWLEGETLANFASDQRILVRLLAAVGCFAAASGFDAGDHLRRAWLFLAASTSLLLVRELLLLIAPFQTVGGLSGPFVMNSLVILANVFFLAGIWRLARSWRIAAITLPGGRSGAVAMGLITAVLALAVAGPGALAGARAILGGDWSSLIYLVSAVVDILSLCLIAPLLLTAVSLRGGLFAWPWVLITASQVSWLLTDAAALAATPTGFPLFELCRGLACNYLFAAGLAQLFVVRQVRRAGVLGRGLTQARAA